MASPLGSSNAATRALSGPVVRAQAKLRYSTIAPMKARRVVDLVRGLPADEALAILRFAPQGASESVYKVLASAVANAQHWAAQRNERLEVEDLVVSQAYVDEGPTLKRFRPRAQGRAYRIRKRTSHITIHVESWPAEAETLANKRAVPKRPRPVRLVAQAPKSPAVAGEASPKPRRRGSAPRETEQLAAAEVETTESVELDEAAAPDEGAAAKKTAAKATAAKKTAAKKAPAGKSAAPKAPADESAAKKTAAKKTAAKKTAAKKPADERADESGNPAEDEGETR